MRGIELFDWRAGFVPPLQGGGNCFWGADTQGFTLGYHIAPFQGYRLAGFPDFGLSGLKARHVTARPEGPGTAFPQIPKPCKGGTRDAESAAVLGNSKALL